MLFGNKKFSCKPLGAIAICMAIAKIIKNKEKTMSLTTQQNHTKYTIKDNSQGQILIYEKDYLIETFDTYQSALEYMKYLDYADIINDMLFDWNT